MFVEKPNSIVLLRPNFMWPQFIYSNDGIVSRFRKDVPIVHTEDDVQTTATHIYVINPNFVQLLKLCTFLQRREWTGKLILTFDSGIIKDKRI